MTVTYNRLERPPEGVDGYVIKDIRTRQRGRRKITYGVLRNARTDELEISATLDYIETAARERGYVIVARVHQ